LLQAKSANSNPEETPRDKDRTEEHTAKRWEKKKKAPKHRGHQKSPRSHIPKKSPVRSETVARSHQVLRNIAQGTGWTLRRGQSTKNYKI